VGGLLGKPWATVVVGPWVILQATGLRATERIELANFFGDKVGPRTERPIAKPT
jgi:hypothetical protein